MSEIERVQALRDAGHITPAEAERLIGVLRELDGVGAEGAAAGMVVGATEPDARPAAHQATRTEASIPGTPPGPPAPPTPPSPPGPSGPTNPPVPPGPPEPTVPPVPPGPSEPDAPDVPPGPDAPDAPDVPPGSDRPGAPSESDRSEEALGATGLAPQGTRWCAIELTAADLSVTSDDVGEPIVDAGDDHDIVVTPTVDGVRIHSKRGPGIDSWIGRVRSLSVSVRLPRAWALALDLKAGDADVRGVRFVHGRMLAGDLDVRGAEAIDVSKAAGDLHVEFRPTRGRHRIVSKAGDVRVTLLPGTDAAVEASVSIGDLHARGFEVERRTVGAQARGRFGDGSAEVEVRLTAGDLKLHAPRSEG
jgi:hypothetical protein